MKTLLIHSALNICAMIGFDKKKYPADSLTCTLETLDNCCNIPKLGFSKSVFLLLKRKFTGDENIATK